CARCHDHKFDPVSQREYYALSAFFDNVDESGLYSHFTRATPTPALALPTPSQQQAEARAQQQVQQLERQWQARLATPSAAFEAWLAAGGEVTPVDPVGAFSFEAIAAGKLHNAADRELAGSVGDAPRLVPGVVGKAIAFDGEDHAKFPKVADFDRHQPFTIAFWLRVPAAYERAVVLHRSKSWTDAGSRGYELLIEDGRLSFALVHFWPGNAIRVRAQAPLAVGRWTHVAVRYDGSSRAQGQTIFVDGRPAAVDVVRDGLTRTIGGGGADALTLAQRFRDRGLKGGAVDELRVFARELTGMEVATLAGREGAFDRDEARDYFERVVAADGRAALVALAEARRALGKVRDAQREIMVMRELATPRATYVRPRGSYLERGERVEPGTPSCLPPLPAGAPRDRLALARWLTDPDHPSTARVAVNRAWQMHFGRGLVATSEDFG
ncbi:MAG: DUF1553 domain-containing protein, partial [Planctomycetes bacterium]|nr:DUF1553 domain-containing protein [Planctomycetota bacterium]